jgi:hypothetical protein
MQLAGTFDPDDFVDILDLLARRRCRGRLAVRAGGLHGLVRLVDGDAVAAEASGSVVVHSKSKWPVTLEYVCFEALRCSFGTFDLSPDEDATFVPGPRVPLKEGLDGGKKRLELWRQVEKTVRTLDAVPRLAEALSADITVDRDSWTVLVALDGRRSIAALAKRLNRDVLELCQVLEPLVKDGAVLLDQPEAGSRSLPKVRLDRNQVDGASQGIVGVFEEPLGGDVPAERLGAPVVAVVASSARPPAGSSVSAGAAQGVDGAVQVIETTALEGEVRVIGTLGVDAAQGLPGVFPSPPTLEDETGKEISDDETDAAHRRRLLGGRRLGMRGRGEVAATDVHGAGGF